MKRRLLFVWSAAEFSTYDVARGYRSALERTGLYNIRDYKLYARIRYHAAALGAEKSKDLDLLLRQSSENVIVEAMKHRADCVFIVSGLALHPDALWYLARTGFKTTTLFTESPYNDEQQRSFHDVYPDMKCFTMEKTSAVSGWDYLAHAFDPEFHQPVPAKKVHDVLMIGTLWSNRIKLLDAVDWADIKLTLRGTWQAPPEPSETRLEKFYDDQCVNNALIMSEYAQAKVCLNIFREHETAQSVNPRTMELAACGAFQLSDYRPELDEIFGKDVIATFTPDTLEEQVSYWVTHDVEREERAERARQLVQEHTFDARARQLLPHL